MKNSVDATGGRSEGLIDVIEAARLMGLSKSKVYKMTDDGTLRCVKIGAAKRIRREDVQALIERCTRERR